MNATPIESSHDFYARIMDVLDAASVDFLVGGAFALNALAGIQRDTKDFDLMLRPCDVGPGIQACRNAGFSADYAFSHWIAKVHHGDSFIDLIFRAGNGLCEVDDEWFAAATKAKVLGRWVQICPPEEMVWQKAFIMERERFDGADIQHLLRIHAPTLNWERLLRRFGNDWRVLFSHLILFGYVYPGQRTSIPAELFRELFDKMLAETNAPADEGLVCQGTLLSRAQYLPDVEKWHYQDARRDTRVSMTTQEIVNWTNAIDRHSRG